MIFKISPGKAHLIGAIAVFITDAEYILNDYKKFMGFSKDPKIEFWIMLSFNICTVPYFLYYYLYKKNEHLEFQGTGKNSEKNADGKG